MFIIAFELLLEIFEIGSHNTTSGKQHTSISMITIVHDFRLLVPRICKGTLKKSCFPTNYFQTGGQKMFWENMLNKGDVWHFLKLVTKFQDFCNSYRVPIFVRLSSTWLLVCVWDVFLSLQPFHLYVEFSSLKPNDWRQTSMSVFLLKLPTNLREPIS